MPFRRDVTQGKPARAGGESDEKRNEAAVKRELQQLADGQISFDRFARMTDSHWERISNAVYRRWKGQLPSSVSAEDLKQEMLIHVWRRIGDFDPSRGKTLLEFVIFNCMARATRYVQCQRNSIRRDTKSASRFPVPFSSIGVDVDNEWIDSKLLHDEGGPDVDDVIDRRRVFDAKLATSIDDMQLFALVALKQSLGDLRRAGELLFEDPYLRLCNRWNSPSAAVAHVETTLMSTYEEALCQAN